MVKGQGRGRAFMGVVVVCSWAAWSCVQGRRGQGSGRQGLKRILLRMMVRKSGYLDVSGRQAPWIAGSGVVRRSLAVVRSAWHSKGQVDLGAAWSVVDLGVGGDAEVGGGGEVEEVLSCVRRERRGHETGGTEVQPVSDVEALGVLMVHASSIEQAGSAGENVVSKPYAPVRSGCLCGTSGEGGDHWARRGGSCYDLQ